MILNLAKVATDCSPDQQKDVEKDATNAVEALRELIMQQEITHRYDPMQTHMVGNTK